MLTTPRPLRGALIALFLAAPAAAGVPPAPLAPAGPETAIVAAGFKVERHVLDNGLVVLLHEDHSVPAVTFWQWYKVGSRNEHIGITGISHFFEHMMFNGSEHVPPKQYDRIIESNGGTSNAFTSRDMTAYHEDIASDRLGVLLDLDADRMRQLSLLPDMLASEIDVVKEERRYSTENDIFGMLDEQLYAVAFNASPYRWPVLGWMGDLERLKREELVDYFRTYYAPDNCILVLVGDFDSRGALARITEKFGSIPRQEPPPPVADSEPVQRGERQVEVHHAARNVTLMGGYKAPSVKDDDAYTLDVLDRILSDGQSSRLYRALVRDRQLAISVGTSFRTRLLPGLFEFWTELRPGTTAEEGIAALDEVFGRLAGEGPTATELAKAQNLLEADFVKSLKTNTGVGRMLGYYEHVYGDYHAMFDAVARHRAVTAEDCRRVARRIFDRNRRTLAILVPDDAAQNPGGEGKP
jgi:zinc protease